MLLCCKVNKLFIPERNCTASLYVTKKIDRRADLLITTCGLGWNDTQNQIRRDRYPKMLQEMHFSSLSYSNCQRGEVCLKPVITGSSICFGDQGSPLYVTRCGSSEPDCLYGVATRWTSTPEVRCTKPNYFTKIIPMRNWILRKLERSYKKKGNLEL